jgi:hypothetical protein
MRNVTLGDDGLLNLMSNRRLKVIVNGNRKNCNRFNSGSTNCREQRTLSRKFPRWESRNETLFQVDLSFRGLGACRCLFHAC